MPTMMRSLLYYLNICGLLCVFMFFTHCEKKVVNQKEPLSAQISKKKSGSENWEIIVNETELGDTVIYFDSYKLELNTTYLYQVRKISEGYESRAITDSIDYLFLPPTLKDMKQII